VIGDVRSDIVLEGLDKTKLELLQLRSERGADDYAEEDDSEEEDRDEDDANFNGDEDLEVPLLTEEQQEFLYDLLRNPEITEDDAELVLSLMEQHSEDVLEYVPEFLSRFPALAKNVYRFCLKIGDKNGLGDAVTRYLSEDRLIPEYQLFWLGKLVEDSLLKSDYAEKLFGLLLGHGSSTELSRSKVLEIPEARFGMPDVREKHLISGQSGWQVWSSIAGSREVPKGKRNYLLKYAGNGSSVNRLLADSVIAL
jgi:hypothetical protein